MGFRNGAIATVWDVRRKSSAITCLRLTVQKKNRNSGEYVTEFSGYVDCIGRDVSDKAAKLNIKDRIVIGDVDIHTVYDPVNNKSYTNLKMYSFNKEVVNDGNY